MYYEDVTIQTGETLSGLAVAYGYEAKDWKTKIWDDAKNVDLVKKRKVPEHIQPGDILHVPIPWVVTKKTLDVEPTGVGAIIERDGGDGTRLHWVQTVYAGNQPLAKASKTWGPFAVDATIPDDNLPYYWTEAEYKKNKSLRKHFEDHPSRGAPTAAMGTTNWRACTSIAVVTGKRATLYGSLIWGFDLEPGGKVTKIGYRDATPAERYGNSWLLWAGVGTANVWFGMEGWTFRWL